MTDFLLLGAVIVALLLLQGFFSGSELALVSADKLKLRSLAARGDRRAALVLKLFEKPESLLATTLIGTNIATVSLSVIGATTVIQYFGPGSEIYAVLFLTPLMLVFGEIVPKSIFQQHADRIAPAVAPLLAVIRALLMPVVLVLGWIGRRITRAVAPEGKIASPFATRQRLRMMLEDTDAGADVAVLDRDRIRRAIRLADMTVGEAMTPLAQVTGAPRGTGMAELLAISKREGQRSIPLYDGNLSNIVAVAVWSIWDEGSPDFLKQSPEHCQVTAHFASAVQRLDELLPVLLARTDHMAVVVDEYGTANGIVTIDQLMTVLLGDVARGARIGTQQVNDNIKLQPDADGRIDLSANTGLADLAELLDVELQTREFHSLGGFLTSCLRRIPATGDEVNAFGYTFTVIDSNPRGAVRVRVEPSL